MDRPWLARRIDASNVSFDTTDMSSGQRVLVACFLGAAFWNSISMVPVVFLTFKRYWTLYFWTILLSNLGVLICATEQIMSVSVPGIDKLLIVVLSSVGWPLMVTGQSLVLYSRLHMLFVEKRTLRMVLGMIIVNAVVIHCTGISLSIGFQFKTVLIVPYSIFERCNISIFFIQESILSGLYLWKSRSLLGQFKKNPRNNTACATNASSSTVPVVRGILSQLILVNIVVVCLDITVIVLEFAGLYQLQLGYKVFAYSVKLQCEIAVLNRLLEFANRTRRLNTIYQDFVLSPVLQQEWDSTLQRAFGSSAQQDTVSVRRSVSESARRRST